MARRRPWTHNPLRLMDSNAYLGLSLEANRVLHRLYFVADRWGRFVAESWALAGAIRVYDPKEVERSLGEIEAAGLLLRFTSTEGLACGELPRWDEDGPDQRKRAASEYLKPGEEQDESGTSAGESGTSAVPAQHQSGSGTVLPLAREMGEERTENRDPSLRSGEQRAGARKAPPPAAPAPRSRDDVARFLGPHPALIEPFCAYVDRLHAESAKSRGVLDATWSASCETAWSRQSWRNRGPGDPRTVLDLAGRYGEDALRQALESRAGPESDWRRSTRGQLVDQFGWLEAEAKDACEKARGRGGGAKPVAATYEEHLRQQWGEEALR